MEGTPLAFREAEAALHLEETGPFFPLLMEGPQVEDTSPRRVTGIAEDEFGDGAGAIDDISLDFPSGRHGDRLAGIAFGLGTGWSGFQSAGLDRPAGPLVVAEHRPETRVGDFGARGVPRVPI